LERSLRFIPEFLSAPNAIDIGFSFASFRQHLSGRRIRMFEE
jgi:hypothetical protein